MSHREGSMAKTLRKILDLLKASLLKYGEPVSQDLIWNI